EFAFGAGIIGAARGSEWIRILAHAMARQPAACPAARRCSLRSTVPLRLQTIRLRGGRGGLDAGNVLQGAAPVAPVARTVAGQGLAIHDLAQRLPAPRPLRPDSPPCAARSCGRPRWAAARGPS